MYTRKDLFSDVAIVSVLALLGFGIYRILKPSFTRAWASRQQHAPRRSILPVGTPLVEPWFVQTLDGVQTIPFSTLKGKVIFLNFWATWCGPCRMELPSIEKLYQRYKESDIVFLCVSEEDPHILQRFVQKHNIHVPVYAVRKVPDFFHVTGLPTTFIVSHSGKVALSRDGANAWDSKAVFHLLDVLVDQTKPSH